MKTNISIGVIGYNDSKNLQKCLHAISMIPSQKNILELIYIDDGSTDDSVKIFNQKAFVCESKIIINKKNMGRAFCRNYILSLAKHKWVLFLNSNIVINSPDFFLELVRSINKTKKKPIAFMGNLKYTCQESLFQDYLNNTTRGTGQYSHLETIQFKHLLFSCCLINKDFLIVNNLQFNERLLGYGGEEILLSYQINKIYPNAIHFNKLMNCTRINHPGLEIHCKRLFDFGKSNLHLLPYNLQREIMKNSFFLNRTKIKATISLLIFRLAKLLYNQPLLTLGFGYNYIIRVLWMSAILNGFYTKK